MSVCPTPCDADCEAVCHEAHLPEFKRGHDEAECILRELTTLKDGPRDADYEARKPLAWQAARQLLAYRDKSRRLR